MKKQKKQLSPTAVVTETYETEIEFNCPVRGKVKQKVTVKRLSPVSEPPVVEETLPTNNLATKLDTQYSGLLISDDSLEDEQKDEIEDGNSVHQDS